LDRAAWVWVEGGGHIGVWPVAALCSHPEGVGTWGSPRDDLQTGLQPMSSHTPPPWWSRPGRWWRQRPHLIVQCSPTYVTISSGVLPTSWSPTRSGYPRPRRQVPRACILLAKPRRRLRLAARKRPPPREVSSTIRAGTVHPSTSVAHISICWRPCPLRWTGLIST